MKNMKQMKINTNPKKRFFSYAKPVILQSGRRFENIKSGMQRRS
jgi:hypothetical protein